MEPPGEKSLNVKFFIGQQIDHNRFSYRGLIYDVDSDFQGTDEWYRKMATSAPPKNQPWYHVLVHGADHTTYVAEQNLSPHKGTAFIDHPLLPNFFNGFSDGVYTPIIRQ